MRIKLFFCIVFFLPFRGGSQSLEDINYNYLYRTDNPFSFAMKAVRSSDNWTIFYELKVNDATVPASNYVLQWERRDGLDTNDASPINADSVTVIERKSSENALTGYVQFPLRAAPKVLSAKIVHLDEKRVWYFPEILRADYPVNGYISVGDKTEMNNYLMAGQFFTVAGFSNAGGVAVSFYTHDFPAGAPAFSEALARVPGRITVDSSFQISIGHPVSLSTDGLYLVQQDTSASQGLAFRVYHDYPKYGKLENLVDPLVYICTRQEFERLKSARGEKKAIDRVILNITGNADRAKDFMRSYFRRVELANHLFSSFKEGWKTDRGMIYIIFGLPDEVFRFYDREVWNYDNDTIKISFSFVRSPTIFDPDNLALIRQKKYQATWYEVIDLWRNARF
jgi:GWxTD domain-containing protein